MSDLLQIFSGNPLTTFVGKKIEAATRPELESEDWALNMEICDIINENDEDAKDAARAIKKRLLQIEQDRNFIVTNRALTLLDTCVSNCSHRFHVLVMTKDFIQDLVKLIGPKNNPPIELQERVLSMIERWADAFRNQPDLGGVVSVCNDLKAKGVVFPPRDPSSHVSIQTPQRSVPPAQRPDTRSIVQPTMQRPSGGEMLMPQPPIGVMPPQARPTDQQPSGQVVLEGEGYNKIFQDLVVVQSSIEMFTDILKALESPTNEEADWRLADELSATCRQMKDRIVDLIERVANEDLTIELLRLNDELNNIFTKYDRLVKERSETLAAGSQQTSTTRQQEITQPKQPAGSQPAVVPSPKLPGVSSGTLSELSLIDFNAASSSDSNKGEQQREVATMAPSTTQAATISSRPLTKPSDPFDTSNISLEKGPQLVTDNLGKLKLDVTSGQVGGGDAPKDTKGSNKAAGLPEEISSVREQDFAEIENWLSTDSGRDLASIGGDMPSIEPISIPNSEFDNFIASRALAGSSASSNQPPKEQTQKRPEPSV